MKKIFLLLFFLTPQVAFSLSGIGTSYIRLEPSTLPTLCRNGDLRVNTSDSQLYMCNGSNTWASFSAVGGGGTGLTSATAHGILLGEGTNAFGFTAAGSLGQFVIGQGSSSDPTWSFTPILGAVGTTGTLGFSGLTSGTVTIQPQSIAGTYNFNLPVSAGSSGQPMISAGGGSSPMTFGTLGVAGGGTGLATLTAHSVQVGNGTSALSQIAVSSSTAFPLVSGGSSADPGFSLLSVAGGGTGLATLTAHSIQVGNGTSTVTQITVPASGTVLTGVASADPAFSATPTLGVNATTDGILNIASSVGSGASIAVKNGGATTGYNFILPTTVGGAGSVLTSQGGGSTAMTWSTPLTNPMTTQGDIIYENVTPTAARLAAGTGGQVLMTGGASANPAWAFPLGNPQSKGANYNALNTDGPIFVTVAAKIITLPSAVTFSGKCYSVISEVSGQTTINSSSGNICGQASITINGTNDSIQLCSDGTNWYDAAKGCLQTVSGYTSGCNSSGSGIGAQQPSAWISSVSNGSGTGLCTINIVSGVFSASPYCTSTAFQGGSALVDECYISSLSSIAIGLSCVQNALAANTQALVTCTGPR